MSEHIAAAEFITVAGKEYEISPINLKELKALERDLQRKALELNAEVIAKMGDIISTEDKSLMMDKAWAESGKVKIGTREFDAAVSSMQGVMLMLYYSLRKKTPAITKDEAEDLITTDNMAEIQAKLFKITGFTNDEKKAKPPENWAG